MAVGTTTAIIGSAVLGAGASAYGASQNRSAINSANRAQQNAQSQQLALQQRQYDQTRADMEPFRQMEIGRGQAFNEFLGLSTPDSMLGINQPANILNTYGDGSRSMARPLGYEPQALNAYLANNPDLQQEFQAIQGSGFGPDRVTADFDANFDGVVQPEEYSAFHYDRFGRAENRRPPETVMAVNDGVRSLTAPLNPLAQGQGQEPLSDKEMGAIAGAPAVNDNGAAGINQQGNPLAQEANPNMNADSSAGALARSQDRFGNSLIGQALEGQLIDTRNQIDGNMSAMGNVYSGARMQAQQDAAVRQGLNATGMYGNFLLGSPSMNATNQTTAAGGAYAANSGNILALGAQNASNTAYARAQNNNALVGGLANMGGYALGNMANPNSNRIQTDVNGVRYSYL
jgi:hypothetical protein